MEVYKCLGESHLEDLCSLWVSVQKQTKLVHGRPYRWNACEKKGGDSCHISEKELRNCHLQMPNCTRMPKSKGRDKSHSFCLFAFPFAQGGRVAVCNRADWEQRLVSYQLDRLSLPAGQGSPSKFPCRSHHDFWFHWHHFTCVPVGFVLGAARGHPSNNALERQWVTLVDSWYTSFCAQYIVFPVLFRIHLLNKGKMQIPLGSHK